MAIKLCEKCKALIDARGRQRFCPPCGKANARELRQQAQRRARIEQPESVRARQKRYRDSHAEAIREWGKRPQYKTYRLALKDQERFGGMQQAVLTRDNRQCRVCGQPASPGLRNLTIHHIDGTKDNNALGNLITLCRTCHPTVHNRWSGATQQEELQALIA